MSAPAKLYNKNNLLPGKIADEFLVFQENKTLGLSRTTVLEVTLPVVNTGYSQEEEETGIENIYPEKIGNESLSPDQDFMIEAKPLIKDLSLYPDKDNQWTNKTFVVTKFEKIIPTEAQLDIEGKEDINHLVAFTSTDGQTLNVKEMTSQEVYPKFLDTQNLLNADIKVQSKVIISPSDLGSLIEAFQEFLKEAPAGSKTVEMIITDEEIPKIYLTAANSETEQTIRGLSTTIPIDKPNF